VDRKIATRTLAELYLSQGDVRKALEIYYEILNQEPSNTEIREAIRILKQKIAQNARVPSGGRSHELTIREKIRHLEEWREKIRMIRKLRTGGDRG
jgi:hypothetical protein